MMIRTSAAVLLCLCSIPANAQYLRFSELDKTGNGNGLLEPGEIPAADLSVISRYASLAGLDMSKPMSVTSLEQARDGYVRALDHRDAPGSLWSLPAGEHEFGRIKGSGVRVFGAAGDMDIEFSESARRNTVGTFLKFDTNRDALLSREEVNATYRTFSDSWFRGDRDNNGLLTFMELAQHFAADDERRNISRAHDGSTWNIDGVIVTPAHRNHAAWLLGKFDKNENGTIDRDEVPDEWKTGNELRWADRNGDGRVTTLEMQIGAVRFLKENESAAGRQKNIDLQYCKELSNDLLRRFDLDRDSGLNGNELRLIGGDLSAADMNSDGLIRQDELSEWLLGQLKHQAAANVPEGTPVWFLESDVDRDGQVLLSEFLQSQRDSNAEAFSAFDQNNDGIVTPRECGLRNGGGKSVYVSRSPRVLEPQAEIWSEIQIQDDFQITDIDVQVSITKDGDDDVELRLVGPDGTIATLYYSDRRKAWGGGRLFENTLIDDEAPEIQGRLPRPPAHRSFRPQSMNNKNLLSLSAFYGKRTRGTWRLVIRNKAQNNRGGAGLLDGWSLYVKAADVE